MGLRQAPRGESGLTVEQDLVAGAPGDRRRDGNGGPEGIPRAGAENRKEARSVAQCRGVAEKLLGSEPVTVLIQLATDGASTCGGTHGAGNERGR